jgi:hypothetical protein
VLVGGALVAAVAVGAGVLGYRSVKPAGPEVAVVVVDAAPVAPPTADAAPVAAAPSWPSAPEPVRARLLAELTALPQEGATRRGVPNEDYLALLSAVDATLCAGGEPSFPPDAAARLQPFRLEPEAKALARYVLTAGELPPQAAGALGAFLARHEAYAPGPPAYGFAGLAVRLDPTRGAHWLSLLRENSALHRWRDRAPGAPAPSGFAQLCDRQLVLERYQALDGGPRAQALTRFAKAAPLEAPLDDAGLRWVVLGAERDDAAATLDLRVRVTNPSAEEHALELALARLGSGGDAPAVDPPADKLGPGLVRELRLRFAGVTDQAAEAAVLVLRPGVELQAYSELLR